MAELVDAPGSGPGGGNTVEVRVLFWAPVTGRIPSLFITRRVPAARNASIRGWRLATGWSPSATLDGRPAYTPDDRILVARERGCRVKLADGTAGPARNGIGRAHATPASSHPTRKRRRNMATSKKNDFMTKVGTVVDAVKDRAQEVGKSLAAEAGKAAASARTGLASASVTLGKTARVVGATAGELAASAQEKTSVAVRAVQRGVAAARAGDTPAAKKPRKSAKKTRKAATKKPRATAKTAKTASKAIKTLRKTAKALPKSAKTRKPHATKPAVK